MKNYFSILFFSICLVNIQAQNCSNLNIQLKSSIASTCPETTMTMLHDRNGRAYLYVANKEAGLKIYSILDISNPILVKQIPSSSLNNLDLMSLSQNGNYLYLALGNTFTANEASGMAIVDVTDPETAFVTDSYVLNNSLGGSGIIQSDGNYAFLGAMKNGILVLNVQNKNNILLESQFVPDFTFPDPTPDSTKINARGMEIRNDTLFLCFDAGGFRIIDATNKQSLQEIGRYSNPLLNGLPRAYNNVVLKNNLAFIAVDYCGVEVIDFSNPQNPVLHGWWNPYNCPTNNWFSSPVHANEIKIIPACNQLFLSTGKSDMMVLDITDPSQPDSCNFYGGVSNNIGTWGIDVYQDKFFLSYVCAIIPFSSNWTGIKSFTFSSCLNALETKAEEKIELFVNNETKKVIIKSNSELKQVDLMNLLGQNVPYNLQKISPYQYELSLENEALSMFFIHIQSRENSVQKFISF